MFWDLFARTSAMGRKRTKAAAGVAPRSRPTRPLALGLAFVVWVSAGAERLQSLPALGWPAIQRGSLMSKNKGSNAGRHCKSMTQQAASRIYRSAAKANGGSVPKRSHAARAQSAAHRNAPPK